MNQLLLTLTFTTIFILLCCIVPYLGFVLLLLFFIPTKTIPPKYRPSEPDSDEVLLFSFRQNKLAYLKTVFWDTKRLTRLKLDNYTCQSCGITEVPLHVHHLKDYDKLGDEDLNSLVSLCSDCHTFQHEQLGYPQTYQDYMNWNVKLVKRNANE